VFGGYFFQPATRIKEGDKNTGWAFPWIYSSAPNSTYHASNLYCSWGAHNTTKDEKADQMYKDATQELDPAKALQKWTDFQTYAHSLYTSIGLCIVDSLTVYGPAIGGFTGPNWVSSADAYAGFQKAKK
jgi:ABC-type transport system substrate-binding protein